MPLNTGSTRTTARTSSGIGTMKAHRQPTVLASKAPSGGPSNPGNSHAVARSARTRGRISTGKVFATAPNESA